MPRKQKIYAYVCAKESPICKDRPHPHGVWRGIVAEHPQNPPLCFPTQKVGEECVRQARGMHLIRTERQVQAILRQSQGALGMLPLGDDAETEAVQKCLETHMTEAVRIAVESIIRSGEISVRVWEQVSPRREGSSPQQIIVVKFSNGSFFAHTNPAVLVQIAHHAKEGGQVGKEEYRQLGRLIGRAEKKMEHPVVLPPFAVRVFAWQGQLAVIAMVGSIPLVGLSREGLLYKIRAEVEERRLFPDEYLLLRERILAQHGVRRDADERLELLLLPYRKIALCSRIDGEVESLEEVGVRPRRRTGVRKTGLVTKDEELDEGELPLETGEVEASTPVARVPDPTAREDSGCWTREPSPGVPLREEVRRIGSEVEKSLGQESPFVPENRSKAPPD